MNQGGEQGHDDYGLPPVDIEIPDDARELFRDVQAYHRELRAMRRHQRSVRWRAPFRRSGVAIPLLAGCLIAALVAVMVSAMFTANPYLPTAARHAGAQPSAGAGRSARSGSSAQPSAGPSGVASGRATRASSLRLPSKSISVAGHLVGLRTLTSTALAIVPANCDCGPALSELLSQVESAGVIVYLVAVRGSNATPLKQLATQTPASSRATRVADDDADALVSAFPPRGLTVLLVDSRGLVTVDSGLRPGLMLQKQLSRLSPGR